MTLVHSDCVRTLVRHCGFAILCGGAATLAHAQSATGTEAQENKIALDEVVVTAQKIETTEQRTPISMTVFSPEVLAREGVGNLDDLVARAPSASMARSGFSSIVTVRGVSSRDTTEVGDPSVAINIDGLYFTRAIGFSDSLFDLERVEILRGPQGTLYGRNATGGAINLISAKPTSEFEGTGAIGFGNYNLLTTEGMLNVPLSERVQLRAAFSTRQHDGYSDNGPARDGDDADMKAGRLSLAVQPTDKLSAIIRAELISLGGVGPAVCGSPLVLDGNGEVVHERPKLPGDGRECPLNEPSGFLDATSKSFRANASYDLGFAELTYQGGYRELDFLGHSDPDGRADVMLGGVQDETIDTTNHELRLSSSSDGRFGWQLGGFYGKDKNDLLSDFNSDATNPPFTLARFVYDVESRTRAAFGHVSFGVSDTVKLSAGIRRSKDDKTRVGFADFTGFGAPSIEPQDNDYSSSKTTYHAGVDWQATPDALVYAKFDTGYKAGGFTDTAPYGPETIEAYEIGLKSRALDQRVRANVSAFYYDYTDQQTSQIVGTRTIIRNAGKSEIYGLEVEGSALLSESDRLDLFAGYLHAEFTEFAVASGAGNIELAGNSPPQSPRYSATVGYEHLFDVVAGHTLTFRLQTHYESKSYLTFYNFDSDKQDAYTRSDVILTYAPDDERWSIEGYVRNIEDEEILTSASEVGVFTSYVYQFADPRTYGMRFSVKW